MQALAAIAESSNEGHHASSHTGETASH
jgi:hypothetical protein